ncbi:microfibril-associated glycoprotein 4-like [Aulostomus maculatus]
MMLIALLAVLLPVAAHRIPLPMDCSDIYRTGSTKDGVYTVYPQCLASPVQVYCDMSEDNTDNSAEKWTVLQRRQDGTVNFLMRWNDYKAGFGNASGEYWLGLETMHLLTQAKNYELRVDMEDFDGQKVYALYSSFSVGTEAKGYPLHLGNFVQGAAGDSLASHNMMKFSTTDRDQDLHATHCARTYGGGFWFGSCFKAHPNGPYAWGPTIYANGVQWKTFTGYYYSLKTMTMKIRAI